MMIGYLRYFRQLPPYLRQLTGARLQALLARTLPALGPVATRLKPDKRYIFNLGQPERVAILLVGCGGTGGWTAHILAQLAGWAQIQGLDLRLYFVDPDTVEQKNLARQNFCAAEVGNAKAFSLAWRYSVACGLAITPVVDHFSGELLDRYQPAHAPGGTLRLVVGAVDNVQARQAMATAISERLPYLSAREKLVWLDAGNERMNGQVVIGNSLAEQPQLSPLGYCVGLPLPHLQEPTLLMARPQPPAREAVSCAELGEQSLLINRAMAHWLGVYLFRLLQSRDLDLMRTHVNLQAGVTRSEAILDGQVILPVVDRASRSVEAAEVAADACPVCGGEVVQGQDSHGGVIFEVAFCTRCDWRQEACPVCGGDIEEDELELEGQMQTVIRCLDCDWAEPIWSDE
jgi:PRTRC genetic system ThiF family protein